jgi:hypothetical protein
MELLPEQKAWHPQVRFEHPSKHGGQNCGGCLHLIFGLQGPRVRCETVKDPVSRADWCERWSDQV